MGFKIGLEHFAFLHNFDRRLVCSRIASGSKRPSHYYCTGYPDEVMGKFRISQVHDNIR